MRKALGWFLGLILALAAVYFFELNHQAISPIVQKIPRPKPLMAYTFGSLKNTQFPSSQIILGDETGETEKSLSQMFYFSALKTPGKTNQARVSGVLNLPKDPGTYPVIIMFRGFVPKESYQPGIGSEPAAKIFAQNGFITLAPDFLGFGQSDGAAQDGFEDRFQTYTTALSLMSSLQNLNSGLEASYSGKIKADLTRVGIWGHSNGGQIALSALSVSGNVYPTALWAPVSKSFPYSILYYTDESDDQGLLLRRTLSNFEEDYDTRLFSPPSYFQWIKAPFEINQGMADQEVPVWWSDDLTATLKKNNLEVTYKTYPGADHNLLPNGWQEAVSDDLAFYKDHFK